MSLFVSARYRFLFIPGGSTCKHLVLFVTITVANVVFCWAMVFHVQFLPINFLFFCVSSLLSPSRSRWFQVVPAHSRWFSLLQSSSSSFLVPRFSMYETVLLSSLLNLQSWDMSADPKRMCGKQTRRSIT